MASDVASQAAGSGPGRAIARGARGGAAAVSGAIPESDIVVAEKFADQTDDDEQEDIVTIAEELSTLEGQQ